MDNNRNLYSALVRAIGFGAGIIILLWLLYKIANVILLLLFAIVLALIINSPVSKLEKKNIRRGWACLIVFGLITIFVFLLAWFIFPKINEQVQALVTNLPRYITNIEKNIAGWFNDYPEIQQKIENESNSLSKWVPSLPETVLQIGNFSITFLKTIVLFIIFISMIVYAVTNPKPLIELYFSFFPTEQRNKAASALLHSSKMLVGWLVSCKPDWRKH